MKDVGVRKVPGSSSIEIDGMSMSLLTVTEINIVLHRLIKHL